MQRGEDSGPRICPPLLISRPSSHVSAPCQCQSALVRVSCSTSLIGDTCRSPASVQVVKPLTKFFQCSYVELLRAGGDSGPKGSGPPVARANVFVSHAWKRPFLDMVAAAESRLGADSAPVFIWVDIFCLNQHSRACGLTGCDCGSKRVPSSLDNLADFPFRQARPTHEKRLTKTVRSLTCHSCSGAVRAALQTSTRLLFLTAACHHFLFPLHRLSRARAVSLPSLTLGTIRFC